MRSDLQIMPDYNACNQVMREVVSDGLVDMDFGSLYTRSPLTPKYLDWVESEYESTGASRTVQHDSIGLSPLTVHHREHTYGLRTHPGQSAPYSPWTVELARFDVPLGHVGLVKGFQQYLAHIGDPNYVYTLSDRWGAPGAWSLPSGGVSETGEWYLRLSRLKNAGGIFESFTPLIWPLPGMPYTHNPVFRDLWYPAGSGPSQNVHLVVPGGYTMRLIYSTPAQDDYRLQVAGHLKGFIQSNISDEVLSNFRTNW